MRKFIRLYKAAKLLEEKLNEESGISYFTNDYWLKNAVEGAVRNIVAEKIENALNQDSLRDLLDKCIAKATSDVVEEFNKEAFEETLKDQLKKKYVAEIRHMIKQQGQATMLIQEPERY